jgi:hypothetical protein
MDRRSFFKTLISTPFLTPFLLASESIKSALQLYVITDSPQLFLPSIFSGLSEYGLIPGQAFALLNHHPGGKELEKRLALSGWKGVSKTAWADLAISFSLLRQKASLSFTLIKSGKVWDVRSPKLFTLWKEMYNHHSPSSLLTSVTFKEKKTLFQPGNYASVYIHGKKLERLWLKKDAVLSFPVEKGKVNVAVKKGRAWITGSSCRHKICLSTPPVSIAGERIICAPNRFLLEVQASSLVDTVIG